MAKKRRLDKEITDEIQAARRRRVDGVERETGDEPPPNEETSPTTNTRSAATMSRRE